MFGISFFSNKVAYHLFQMNYSANKMPPINIFKPLCDALKANGYNSEEAARLWLKCLRDNDKEAIKEFYESTGGLASTLLGPLEE